MSLSVNLHRVLCRSGMDDGILFEPNVVRLRQARRLVASGMAPRELDRYRAHLRADVVRYLGRLAETPNEFFAHTSGYALDFSAPILIVDSRYTPGCLSESCWISRMDIKAQEWTIHSSIVPRHGSATSRKPPLLGRSWLTGCHSVSLLICLPVVKSLGTNVTFL